MSGSNELSVKISAIDSASAIINKLSKNTAELNTALGQLTASYGGNRGAGKIFADQLRAEVAASNELVAALRAQGSERQAVMSVLTQQGQTASQVYARMQEAARAEAEAVKAAEREKQQAIKETILARREAQSVEERAASIRAAPRIQSVSRSGITGSAASALSGVSAAESAKAFSSLTDFERILGDKEYTVAFAAQQERIAAAMKKTMATMNEEIYTARQLREELSIPTPPTAGVSRAGAVPMAVPGFLSRQTNGLGAEAETAGKAIGARMGRGITGGVNTEARHAVALFDELARGNRGAMMSTLGAAARDAGLGIGALASSMGALIVVMAGVRILEKAEQLGKWATQSRAAASATGMSLEQYTALSASLKSMGLSAAEADASFRRVGQTLSQAIADPASKAAEAFHNMGITQEQLAATGGNVHSALMLLADAYARTADGANKTANMNEIAGRGFEKLIPLIQDGSDKVRTLEAEMKRLGLTLDESGAKKLEAAGDAVRHLGESIEGQGIKSMVAWSPVIIEVAHSLEELAVAAGKVIELMGRVQSVMAQVATAPGRFGEWLGKGIASATGIKPLINPTVPAPGSPEASGPRTQVPPLTTPVSAMATMRTQESEAALKAANASKTAQAARMAEARAEIQVMQQTLASGKLSAADKESVERELAQKQITLQNEVLSASDKAAKAGAAAAKRAAKQSYEDFAAAEKQKIAAAEGSITQIKAIYDEWAAAAKGQYNQPASVVTSIQRDETKAVTSDQLKNIQTQHQDEGLSQQAIKLSAEAQVLSQPGNAAKKGDAGLAQTTPAQYTAEAGQIETSFQTYKAQLQAVADAAVQGGEVQRAAQQAILQETISAKSAEIQLYNKAAEAAAAAAAKMAAPFTKFFDQVGSQFESMTTSVLDAVIAPQQEIIKAGLSSIKINERSTQLHQVFQKFALDMVNDSVKAVEGAVSHGIASTIDSSIQGGIGDLLGKTLSKLFSSALSSIAGNTAGAAAGSAVSSAAGSAAGSAVSSAAGSAVGSAASATRRTAVTGRMAVRIVPRADYSFSSQLPRIRSAQFL